ncbi:hypothetical protein WICPIJ_004180 [Wickerhamomyces pijperi]|uniref:Uncharacterized protein n=1 Tax=Wickerhamomyces pijperi TaxID=599730 RepID=A0A9P8Q5R2_WICPI|nr:hypothetical protein WICPIJ_004180 [Wickerhamomyces pijperi]
MLAVVRRKEDLYEEEGLVDPLSGVSEQSDPWTVAFPVLGFRWWVPGVGFQSNTSFWMRHHGQDTTVWSLDTSNTVWRTVRVEWVLFSDVAIVVNVSDSGQTSVGHVVQAGCGLERGTTFTVSNGNWELGALHALQEDGFFVGLFDNFHHGNSGFVLLTGVLFESWPVFCAWDHFSNSGDELTTVTGTKGESSTQDITVRETTTGSKTDKVIQGDNTVDDISHVDIDWSEASLLERPSHFHLTVDTLLSQDGNLWLVCEGRNTQVQGRIVGQLEGETWIRVVQDLLEFLVSALWVVSQSLQLVGSLRPGLLQLASFRDKDFFTVELDIDGLLLGEDWFSDQADVLGRNTVFSKDGLELVDSRLGNLEHRTQFFVEEGCQQFFFFRRNVNVQPTSTSKGHFEQGDDQTTIGSIVLADNLTASKDLTSAANKLIRDSATHNLAEAAAEIKAMVGFSPMAKASPVEMIESPKEVAVTPTSATGTCHGPTIWSRSIKPVTVLSPMVIKKLLEPTAGKWRTRDKAFSKLTASSCTCCNFKSSVLATLDIFGGLPNKMDISRSIGVDLEDVQVLGGNTHDVTFLRFVTPDFHWRHTWFQGEDVSQFELGTQPVVMDKLWQGVGQTTGTNIVDRLDWVSVTKSNTGVNDLLGTTLHFWVTSLDRGEIQISRTFTRGNGGGSTTTETNQHGLTTKNDQGRAWSDLLVLQGELWSDGTHTTGNHDWLVETSDFLLVIGVSDLGGQSSEEEAMWPGLPTFNSHGCSKSGINKSETEKPPNPHLDLEPLPTAPSSLISPPEPVAAPANGETAVGWLWVSTLTRVWTLSAWEVQTLVFGFGVNNVEDLVTTMFGVNLGKHEQLDIGWVSAHLVDKGVHQVVDFTLVKSQTKNLVSGFQLLLWVRGQVHFNQRLRRVVGKKIVLGWSRADV